MSLVRAFTTRRNNRPEKFQNSFLSRAASQRSPTKPSVLRSQISAPVALISTTNNLCYEAPDIEGTSPIAMTGHFSSASSVTSSSVAYDSDASSTSARSRDTMTDASSVDEPSSPEPNHLSCYFKPSVYTDDPSRTSSVMSGRQDFDAPIVPQRAPSHSKRAHVQLSRERSVRRAAAPPTTASDLTAESHPFSNELEQLNEVAEEFGSVVRDAEADADRVFMEAHGLASFSSYDYRIEISNLMASAFEDETPFEQAGWI